LPLPQVNELKEKMLGSGMPWPGDEGNQRWEQAWMAIKKVFSSTIDSSYLSVLHTLQDAFPLSRHSPGTSQTLPSNSDLLTIIFGSICSHTL
jgi:hypothetical protein